MIRFATRLINYVIGRRKEKLGDAEKGGRKRRGGEGHSEKK